ncbi:7228_t:CDS:1, partial [Racocetra fulgida]
MIRIPNHMVIPWKNEKSLQALIEYIYPNLTEHHLDISYFTERAILATKNEYIDHINDMILDQTPGDIITYKSYDSVPDDTRGLYQQEFLNSITPNGLPPYELCLK